MRLSGFFSRAHDGLAAAHQANGVHANARHHSQQALALYIDLGAPETQRIRTQLALDGRVPTSHQVHPYVGPQAPSPD